MEKLDQHKFCTVIICRDMFVMEQEGSVWDGDKIFLTRDASKAQRYKNRRVADLAIEIMFGDLGEEGNKYKGRVFVAEMKIKYELGIHKT